MLADSSRRRFSAGALGDADTRRRALARPVLRNGRLLGFHSHVDAHKKSSSREQRTRSIRLATGRLATRHAEAAKLGRRQSTVTNFGKATRQPCVCARTGLAADISLVTGKTLQYPVSCLQDEAQLTRGVDMVTLHARHRMIRWPPKTQALARVGARTPTGLYRRRATCVR